MKNRKSIFYKILVIISIMVGITLDLLKSKSLITLAYYTAQSNLICFIAFVSFVYMEQKNCKKEKRYYVLKGGITIMITITMLVYHVAISPVVKEVNWNSHSLANSFVHVISPVLVILDYFLFDKKGNFKFSYPLIWMIFPSFYPIFVYLYHFSGGRFFELGGSIEFAYFFLDYKIIGMLGVISWILKLLVFFLILGILLFKVDNILKREK